MKSSLKLIVKILLFTYILCLTPFFSYLPSFLGFDASSLSSNLYTYDLTQSSFSVKERLNMIQIHNGVLLSDRVLEPFVVANHIYVEGNKKKEDIKKVYIYNTHQQEEYLHGKTVIDASIQLANLLQKEGIQVVYESHDFSKWLAKKGLDYNSSYAASSAYLNDALVKYGGFDLIVDFHRDAIPRESSYITIANENYAKMMFVVGGLSKNVDTIKTLSNTLSSYVQLQKKGVMKNVMIREAYYNQDISNKMILVEVGSNNNTYEEVMNSTKLLKNAIVQYLMR